jgi:hypothetical protein
MGSMIQAGEITSFKVPPGFGNQEEKEGIKSQSSQEQ